MSIEFVSATQKRVSGSSYAVGGLSLSPPSGTQPGDVLVAAAYMPSTEFAASGGIGRFYRVTASEWQLADLVRFRVSNERPALATYIYVVPETVPLTLRFDIERTVLGVVDAADQTSLDVAVACYRGVDPLNPVQALARSANPDDVLSLAILRAPATVVQTSGGSAVADSLTARLSVGTVRVADGAEPTVGQSDFYSVSTSGAIARTLLGLNPVAELADTDPVPTSGTGVGAVIAPRDPLIVRAQRYQDGAFVEDTVPRALGAELVFDALGCCMGGSVTFDADPLWEPYTRRVELYYDTLDGIPRRYYAGVAMETSDQAGLYVTRLMDMSMLWLDGPVGMDDYPTHIVISETLNLNSGLAVDRLPSTAHEYETWRRFLKKRFAGVPEAVYGVGAEGRYVQGRPQDGAPLTLDARLYPDATPQPATLPPYVSEYFVMPDDATTSVTVAALRTDLPALAPRRIEQATMGPSGAEIPEGFELPYYEPPSYEITIADRIAIPPFLVVELPGGESQYSSGSRVQITVDIGAGATLTSTIRTRTIPYPGTARRDRLGRFA